MPRYRALFVFSLVAATVGSTAGAADPFFEQSVIFSSGDGYPVYRIPAIVTSSFGTLLAFAEGRPTTADLGENDIVLKRSLDNGTTWQTMQVPLPHAVAGVPTRGYNSPTPVVDQTTGEIYLFATVPALAGVNNYYDVVVTKSSDDGVTWSSPTSVSASIRPSDDKLISAGPGHAVQLSSGRLIVPFYSRDLNDGSLSGETHIFYSDDQGTSWQLGGEVPKPANYPGHSQSVSIIEPSLVETDNGLYMSMRTRNFGSSFNRSYAFSSDGGLTWTTSQIDPTLLDSNTQGSVARWTTLADDGLNRILLSNTYSTTRENLSVQTSYDEALSWTNQRTLFFGLSAYSDMAAGGDGLMNVLYENGRATDPRYASISQYQQITLARFNTEWLEAPTKYSVRYDFAEQASGTAPGGVDASIRDSSPWQLHSSVTTTGTMVYVQGSPHLDGRAVRLSGDGAGTLISDPDSQQFYNLTVNDSFTIDAVIRSTMTGTGMIMGRGTFVTDASPGFFPHWYFQIVDGGYLNLHLRDDNGVIANLMSTVTITDGEWHSIAAIRDVSADLLSLVVDGEQVGLMIDPTSSFDSLLSSSSVWIGFNGNHSAYLSADLDMVRFTRGALSASELVSVPEPGSVALTLTAVGGFLWRRRRRLQAKVSITPVTAASEP